MRNRQAMLELIRQAYAARGEGDLDGLMKAFQQHQIPRNHLSVRSKHDGSRPAYLLNRLFTLRCGCSPP